MYKPNDMENTGVFRGWRVFALLALVVVGFGALGGIAAGRMLTTDLNSGAEASIQDFLPPETHISRMTDVPETQPEWLSHSVAYQGAADEARLAIVVVDEGQDTGATLDALQLNYPVTLAVSPSVDGARIRAEAAQRQNREVILLLPMHSENQFDTAPNPIASYTNRDELQRRLAWNFAQLDGYVGVMNQFGEPTTRDAQTMRTVMEELLAKGLLYIDARTHPESVAGAVARRIGVASGDSNLRVKSGSDSSLVRAQLHAAAVHAREWGNAVILIPAERQAVEGLRDWFAGGNPDVAITPLTAVVRRLRSGAS